MDPSKRWIQVILIIIVFIIIRTVIVYLERWRRPFSCAGGESRIRRPRSLFMALSNKARSGILPSPSLFPPSPSVPHSPSFHTCPARPGFGHILLLLFLLPFLLLLFFILVQRGQACPSLFSPPCPPCSSLSSSSSLSSLAEAGQ